MSILVRCDGSIDIGMGHVVRCLALADHLHRNYDCNIYFAMRGSELGIKKVKESYPVFESNENKFIYKSWLSDCITKINARVIIMDMRDGLTREELMSIKNNTGINVVTIDDPEEKRKEADLAFYPPVPQLKKFNWDGFNGDLYVGWKYVILRNEFLKNYSKPNNITPNIFVSMGGADKNNMTEFVITSLKQINKKFKVTIMVGSGYRFLRQLKNSLNDVHFEFELAQNPKNVAGIMSQSDFAIISFGQTAYELAALKVPTLYLCITKDHEASAELFVKNRLGKTLRLFSENNASLINQVHNYMDQGINLKHMTNNLFFDLTNISYPIISLSNE